MQKEHQRLISKHYSSIDFIKGICILFVVVTHYSWQSTERLKLLFPFWIDMAVPIFMIISGFVYTKSFQKNQITTIDKAYTVNFIIGKVIRYSIPFIIAFLIEVIVFNMLGTLQHSVMGIFFSFLCGGFGQGSYYYPVMMQFVFYFPVIYAIIRKYDFKGLIICGIINFLYEILKSAYGMTEGCYRLLVFRYTLLIAYGCYVAMGNYIRHKKLSVFAFLIGIVYISACRYFDIVPPITNYWTGTSFWACLFIIPLSKPIILNNCSNRFVETLGRASYHIFLTQMVYYSLVYDLVPYRWVQLIISIVACIVGGLVFYYIETPVTKKILKITYALCETRKEIPS